MESRIKAINWKQFGAESLPDFIIGLLSTHRDERLKAYHSLLRYFHQHDDLHNLFYGYKEILSTDAPLKATPFLVELAVNDETQDKARVIEILDVLAKYREMPELDKDQQRRASEIHQQIGSQFDAYTKYLKENDQKLRLQIILLLSHFTQPPEPLVKLLLDHIEVDERVPNALEIEKISSAQIIYDLIHQNDYLASDYLARFRRILEKWIDNYFETLSVKANAAFYLIKVDGAKTNLINIKILCNILKLPTYHHLVIPFFESCVEAFWGLGAEMGTSVLIEIFEAQTTRSTVYDLATLMLLLSFDLKDGYDYYAEVYKLRDQRNVTTRWDIAGLYFGSQARPLKENQIRILKALAEKEVLWETETGLFHMFGLPNSQSTLQMLLEKKTGN